MKEVAIEWSLLPCLSRAQINHTIFHKIISFKFYFKTLELQNIWSSRGFYSKFTAIGWNPGWFLLAGLVSMPLSNNIVIVIVILVTLTREWQGHKVKKVYIENGERFTQKQRIRGRGWTNGMRELAYKRERERERERERVLSKKFFFSMTFLSTNCFSLPINNHSTEGWTYLGHLFDQFMPICNWVTCLFNWFRSGHKTYFITGARDFIYFI